MHARFLTPRFAAVAASAAVLGLGAATTATGQTEYRANQASVPVAANEHVKVVKTTSGRLVAESLVTGRRTPLGAGVSTALVDVDGSFVGYTGRFNDRIQARALNAKTGAIEFRAKTPNVMALEVRRTGTIVWVTQHDRERSVHAMNNGGFRTLGTGDAIDPRSLAIADSDATTAHVYWTDGREPGVSPVE